MIGKCQASCNSCPRRLRRFANCARCLRRIDNDQSFRCHRLNKDCQLPPAVRKGRSSRKTGISKSVERLGEKLDGICEIIQRSQGDLGIAPAPVSEESPVITSHGSRRTSSHSSLSCPQVQSTSKVPDKPNLVLDYPHESEAELAEYLETYRTKMVPYFPIVCIAAEMTMIQLKQERPFLYLVIRTICSKNLRRQAALILQVKKVLGRQMLLEGEKSLDLFLGVLVFASWSHLYICDKPIVSTIMQLGISLAFDLGLMRPLPNGPVNPMRYSITRGYTTPQDGKPLSRTMEERRAAVGLYLVSSV